MINNIHVKNIYSYMLSLYYILSELSENYNDSRWWGGRFNERINIPIQRKISPPSSATNVLNEEWDVLIIMDACRADMFNEVIGSSKLSNHKRNIVQKTSNASATPEWLQRTFGDSHGDIVYVTGNPMVTRHKPNCFHKLVESWRNAYNNETSVIEPKKVTNDGLNAYSNFSNKRIIIHYMQPHYPFIDHPELNYADFDFDDVGLDPQREEKTIHSVWDALEAGIVKKTNVWEGYKHNLKIVLEEVNKLVNKIDGQIVITSDHGNMLGEYNWPIPTQIYGHPNNMRHKYLVRVPWLVIDGEKREIIKEGTSSSSSTADQEIRNRLSDLGYIE